MFYPLPKLTRVNIRRQPGSQNLLLYNFIHKIHWWDYLTLCVYVYLVNYRICLTLSRLTFCSITLRCLKPRPRNSLARSLLLKLLLFKLFSRVINLFLTFISYFQSISSLFISLIEHCIELNLCNYSLKRLQQ